MSERFKQGQEVFYYPCELPEDLSKAKTLVLKNKFKECEDYTIWATNDGLYVEESCLGENPETAWYRTAIWTLETLKKDNALLKKEQKALAYYCNQDFYYNELELNHNEEEISRIENLLFAKGFYCNQEQEENL